MVVVDSAEGFEAAFGQIGLEVGPRTGPMQRTKDKKEWYVIRRFLKASIDIQMLVPPFGVRKGEPPEPDFVLEQNGEEVLFEITEASDPADQREMTEFELSDQSAILLGHFGGRFKEGASESGYAWSSDVVKAIERKINKAVFQRAFGGHLIVYPNSNASFLLFDFEDECRAFGILRNLLAARGDLARAVRKNVVHILAGKAIFFDVLGEGRCVRRQH